MNWLLTIVSLLIGGALQARLPALGGIRLEFLPAVAAFGTLTLGRTGGFICALLAGGVQDALSAAPFGVSVLGYGAAFILVDSLHSLLDRELPPLQMMAGAIYSAGATIAAGFFGGKMLVLALVSALLTPFVFFALDFARYQWRHE